MEPRRTDKPKGRTFFSCREMAEKYYAKFKRLEKLNKKIEERQKHNKETQNKMQRMLMLFVIRNLRTSCFPLKFFHLI